MTTRRRLVIQDDRPGAFHVISCCVRRAFLCGDAAEHRRAWLELGIKTQVQAFSINVLTFAVIGNHLHIVVKTDPYRTQDSAFSQINGLTDRGAWPPLSLSFYLVISPATSLSCWSPILLLLLFDDFN